MDKAYYEQTDLWTRPPQTYQRQVLTDILELIPEDVKSLLDVGCGNGFITNCFPKEIYVAGTDISMKALQFVDRIRVVSSVAHLPFYDKSFDLVQATDVIEHLPEKDYPQALQEIQRVAKKYILIGVPFMENLASGLTKCAVCGYLYHVNHHYRSFGIPELFNLLGGDWMPTVFVFSGDTIDRGDLYFRSFRKRLGVLTEWELAVCPQCGAKASIKSVDNITEHAIAVLTHYVPLDFAMAHPDRSKCLVLYENRSVPNSNKTEEDALELVYKKLGRFTAIPVQKVYRNHLLIIKTDIAEPSDLRGPLWLSWKICEQVYRYPNPEKAGINQFLVPAWFSPINLNTLSPLHSLWEGDVGNQLLLVAIKNMEAELELRRGFRGALRTILDRFGFKKFRL